MSDIYDLNADPDDELPICCECLGPIHPYQETAGDVGGFLVHMICEVEPVDDIGGSDAEA